MSRLNQLNKQLLESLHLLITYVDFLPYFYPEQKNVSRAENFRMVYIEINAWSSLFLNLKTNLILYL